MAGRRSVWAFVAGAAALAGGAAAQPSICGVAANCQGFDAARAPRTDVHEAGGYISDVNSPEGFGTFVADSFFAGTAGQVTSVCWWGRYNMTGGVEQSAAAESFRITYYRDAGGMPDTSASGVLRKVTVGGSAPTAGTTLTRVAALAGAPAVTGQYGPGRQWNATHGGFAVAAGQRVWVEIAGASSLADGSTSFRWLWSNSAGAAPNGDGQLFAVAGDPPVYSSVDASGPDAAFCVNVGAGTDLRPLAPNARCEAAAPVALPAPLTSVSVDFNGGAQRALLTAAPFCKDVPLSGPAVWYTFVGNGRRVDISTCDSAVADFDTALLLYCGSCTAGSTAALNCVAANDAGGRWDCGPAPRDASHLADVSLGAGVRYYLAVAGVAGSQGSFRLVITDIGVIYFAQPVCATDRCPVDLNAIPAANREAEACGPSSASTGNGSCWNAATQRAVLGQWYAGTVSGADPDFWEIQSPGPAGWFRVDLRSEFPATFALMTGDCPTDTPAGPSNGAFVTLAPTDDFYLPYCADRTYYGRADATGKLRLSMSAVTETGVYCGQDNDYAFRVSAEPQGSCCTVAGLCTVTPRFACVTTGGGSFLSGAACAPSDCSPTGTTACCRGSVCQLLTAAGCVIDVPGAKAGARSTVAAACSVGSPTNPCCKSDYNKVLSTDLVDIFDFLGDWFAGVRFADHTGDGTLDLLDIFAYLSDWYVGPCR